MNIKIFIITHKEVQLPSLKDFEPLLVGAINKSEIKQYKNRDDDGNNISQKNKNYCELTGLYWIWKNIEADVVGVCHYRRFFSKSHWSNSEKYFLNGNDIEKIMEKFDVIVPKPFFYKKNVINSVNIAPNKKDIEELGKAIKKVAPDYYESYKRFLLGHESYLYNMCIMKKKLFDQYCNWLFPILEYMEKNYDISHEDEYRSRLFGFLSERLLKVWMLKNIDNKKVKHVRVIKTDESSFKAILHDVKNMYRYLAGHIYRK